MNGSVALVGAGPGDPDLLTVRAARLIAAAEVVVHDRLVHPGVLALIAPTARAVDVGKQGGGASTDQRMIEALLVGQARLGHRVVRLKGGDPFVFGRGGEEALALARAGIPFEIVPGVSAGVAGPAAAWIPVTHRGLARSVTFATATSAGAAQPAWDHLARAETLVIFMGGTRLREIAANLTAAGRAATTPAAVISAATWESEHIVFGTLATIADAAVGTPSPALLVVGEVVTIGAELRALAGIASLPTQLAM